MGTLLIVDDERTNLEIYSRLLSGLDYTILFAPNGKAAIDIAQKRLPDMIIMDWQMPILNGLEAMKAIKNTPATHHIPIVIATGVMLSAENLLTAFDAGAHGYIPKPFRKLDLMAVINATLNFANTQHEIQKKNEELEKLNSQKEHVLNIVAHDLQSPLNKLKSLIQLTEMSGELSVEQTTYLGMMPKIIDEGKALIKDLLDLHSYEQKSSNVNFKMLAVDDFIENCIREHEQQAAKKRISLQLNVEEDGLQCYSDPHLLGRVIDNLLSNAIKFSDANKSVQVGVRATEEYVQF
ncbi:MAG: hybrid sensor histidine kinase/response regulator, partial [Flammeovirgaceae bacterium]